jgi:hypothetical protein
VLTNISKRLKNITKLEIQPIEISHQKKLYFYKGLFKKAKKYIQETNNTLENYSILKPIYNKALNVFPDIPKITDKHLNNQNLFISWLSEIKNFLITYKSALQIITNFKQKQQMKNFIN